MTSANIMNLGTVAPQKMELGTKKSETDISSAFASLLTQPVTQNMPDLTTKSQETVQTDTSASDASVAYDKFSYQDKQVDQASDNPFSEKMDAAKEEVESFEEELVETISDELDLSTEDVWNELETLGLTVFDLLNPQKLADVFADLTGMENQVDVLMDADFENLFTQINALGQDLLQNLGLTMDDLKQMTAEMPQETLQEDMAMNEAPVIMEQRETTESATNLTETVENAELTADTTEETKVEVVDKREKAEIPEQGKAEQVSAEETKPVTEEKAQEGARDAKQEPDGENPFLFHQETSAESAPVEQAPESFTYVDPTTLDVIKQVADNVRVVISNNETSMSMQLNPENLGKVLINVTTKEGVVNAQITAENQIVKEALESQLADLRANLNDSGVRVNEIEITVATHEFESNLDQNGREEQKKDEERQGTKRRNLSMDSLDDLSGLMTEEEQLAMQIMHDQGNSLDLNA